MSFQILVHQQEREKFRPFFRFKARSLIILLRTPHVDFLNLQCHFLLLHHCGQLTPVQIYFPPSIQDRNRNIRSRFFFSVDEDLIERNGVIVPKCFKHVDHCHNVVYDCCFSCRSWYFCLQVSRAPLNGMMVG